jgi:DNA-binding transcriptional regulator LsrR (DeoR family)
MARVDELRLMAKVARMYYIQELNQQAITEKL